MMKRLVAVLTGLMTTWAAASGGGNVLENHLESNQVQIQNTQAIGGGYATADSSSIAWAEGGSADSDSVSISEAGDSSALLYFAPKSVSNYETRTQPVTTYPPYLPMWQHGGWGTIKAYFPNGPTMHDRVYERTLDPSSEVDMHEIKGILRSLPYSGALEAIGGFFNGVSRLFGGPDQSHHGRGFEIANSLIRDRRPDGKPLLVFIDSYVDAGLLEEEAYAYVGRVSLEGTSKRNWDHVYNAAIAETLPWDVDILLISGGMKGVTVGSTASLSGGGGYSQTNYSLSLFPGISKGVTEGKGEAVLSATGYRFCPEMLERRRIPVALYDRIRVRPRAAAAAPVQAPARPVAVRESAPGPAMAPAPLEEVTEPVVAAPMGSAEEEEHVEVPPLKPHRATGIGVSQELYNMAGFGPGQTVNNVIIR
ncbi:MAG: hypothetical protein JSW27_00255 [Phycisphaerales bacterium]|nr:MAG: hypothetical protein JSW27_00255 [Phycisphaerales bacterium]